jgi:hypothetical protein
MKKAIKHSIEELELAKFDLEKCLNTKSESFKFNTFDLSLNYFYDKISPNINGDKHVIYIIKINRTYDLTQILNKYKSSDANIKFPQINKENFDSEVLYVGSVQNNFKGRIKQHLGFGSESTYSLKLAKWAKKEKLDVVIEYFVLENTSSKITLRLIENILANILKPQFGKHDKIKT